jgi:Domain of unknown function (DUF4282)
MSNPHDDPGRRPPPPRQGDPPSYQGGPPPHQGDRPPYQGPPPQQPGPPWQGPPGYGPPPQHPAYGPGKGKGFFGALFDINFDHMITVRLARAIYTMILVMISLFALVVLWYGLSFFAWNATLAVMTIIAAPLIWLFDLVLVRVFMEFVINQFKITEHLKALREREGLR